MTTGLFVYGTLGVASTAFACWANRRLFSGGVGRPTLLEGLYVTFAVAALGLGWYFNVRYVHQTGSSATYWNFTKAIFANPAADSAAQDTVIVNLVLLPLWTIVDGRRRGLRHAWIFFVMSLFTSLAFAMGFYLAFVERQERYRALEPADSSTA